MANEQPVAQYLKCVTILDIVPGHEGKPGDGEPIAIVTLEHNGEIEQPMMFTLPDVKRVAFDMMSVLAHHGHELAQEILATYFQPKRDETETDSDT